MTQFIIANVFSLIAIYIAIFSITANNFTIRPRVMIGLKIFAVVIITGLVCFAYKENSALEATNASQKAKIDSIPLLLSSTKNEIHDTAYFFKEQGIDQTKLTEKNITDAVAKGVELGLYVAKQNKEAISTQIRDSTNKPPDLEILPSNSSDYAYAKAKNKWDLVLGLINNQNAGKACGIKFDYQWVGRYSTFADRLQRFIFLAKGSVFQNTYVEISGGSNKSTGFFPKLGIELTDTLYCILDLRYSSQSGKKYSSQKLFVYIPSSGLFTPYMSTGTLLGEFLKANGYFGL